MAENDAGSDNSIQFEHGRRAKENEYYFHCHTRTTAATE